MKELTKVILQLISQKPYSIDDFTYLYDEWLPTDEIPFDEVIRIIMEMSGSFKEKPTDIDVIVIYFRDLFIQIYPLEDRKAAIETFLWEYQDYWYLKIIRDGRQQGSQTLQGIKGWKYFIEGKKHFRDKISSNIKAAKKILDSIQPYDENVSLGRNLAYWLELYIEELEEMAEAEKPIHSLLAIKQYRPLKATKTSIKKCLAYIIKTYNITVSASDLKAAIDAL